MTRELVPLSMSTVEQLPVQCRSCVSWEMQQTAAAGLSSGDAAFEKEVWLSGVMLTWGSAGLLATVDGQPAGFALYAPPTAVPGAALFPTAPVSPDAVLLTVARIAPEQLGRGLGRYLMNGVVTSLTRRGVRAIEAFGREDRAGDSDVGSTVPRCLLPAGFLRAVGFADVQSHHRYPRLRFELSSGLGWKAEVEAALEKLFTVIVVPAPVLAERALAGAGRTANQDG